MSSSKDKSAAKQDTDVKLVGSATQPTPRRRKFPGPARVDEKHRVAFSRQAYADLISHAKESLNAEICGVLIGEWCEDDQGEFIVVDYSIRGAGAKEGSTHVTFTQETWNQIHSQKEQLYPKLQIVGWYHTHPGFGVEFSEMDLFIHRNFFSGPSQVAFVTDPLGGEEAMLVNSGGGGVSPVTRFWVDGRERRCNAPRQEGGYASSASSPTSSRTSSSTEQTLRAMEERLAQLMLAVESQHNALHRFLFGTGVIIGLALILFITYTVYSNITRDYHPPEVQSFVPVPVQMGDKVVMLGVGIVRWDVPKELNAAYLELERQKQQAEAEAQKRAAASATTGPATNESTKVVPK